jgi:hypothetical protein
MCHFTRVFKETSRTTHVSKTVLKVKDEIDMIYLNYSTELDSLYGYLRCKVAAQLLIMKYQRLLFN